MTDDAQQHPLNVKPDDMQQLCVTLTNAPYTLSGDLLREATGGVLSVGQKVWIHDMPAGVRRTRTVDGFVAGLGPISIQGSLLKRISA